MNKRGKQIENFQFSISSAMPVNNQTLAWHIDIKFFLEYNFNL